MYKIKKGDTVQVTTGKDKGKKGKVISLMAGNTRALVEAINLVKKARRQTQQNQQGGIVSIEAPISISNLMLICKSCNKPTRIGFRIAKDGRKERICKRCQGVL